MGTCLTLPADVAAGPGGGYVDEGFNQHYTEFIALHALEQEVNRIEALVDRLNNELAVIAPQLPPHIGIVPRARSLMRLGNQIQESLQNLSVEIEHVRIDPEPNRGWVRDVNYQGPR